MEYDDFFLLSYCRRIMDRIHEHGNIFYDCNRMEAYTYFAKLASITRFSVMKGLE